MADGTYNVEGQCKRSSILRRFFVQRTYFEASNSSNDVYSGHEGRKNGGGGTDAQGKEPYQFERTGTEDDFATAHLGSTSAQDSLEPLQLALVLICMHAHTNEHVLQFSLCGGGCTWW